jgi:hypothetical protein
VTTGKEVARYHSATNITCTAGQMPENKNCSSLAKPGSKPKPRLWPSRTAIDKNGNAWVAHRGFGGFSSVTKIAGDESFCVDRNGSGTIETSRDSNKNGAIEPGEVLALGNDECVLFTTQVCAGHNGARALALDANGDAWVGCYDEEAVYQLDSKNGSIKRGPIALGIKPYGAIVDSQQNLWLTTLGSPNNNIQGVNTQTGAVLTPPSRPAGFGSCYSYGLAVDRADRVWLSGGCFYDTKNKTWGRCKLAVDGIGIVVDTDYNIYTTSGSSLRRNHWDDATNTCTPYPIKGTSNAMAMGVGSLKGVGLDADGNPWVVAHASQAARVDLSTGAILRTNPATGHSPIYYTYSDFTGYQMRQFTAANGTYTRIIEGCLHHSFWQSLSWEANVPEGTQIEVYVRFAKTRAELSSAARQGPLEKSSDNLSKVQPPSNESTFMQLEFVLLSSEDRKTSPALRSYEITTLNCTPPLR